MISHQTATPAGAPFATYPIPYVEAPYTSLHRGSAVLCNAIAEAAQSASRAKWFADLEKINSEPFTGRRLTGDDLVKKMAHWMDSGSGVPGRDRILCVGTNEDPNVDRIALQYYKWSNQCDRTLIFTKRPSVGRDVPQAVNVEIHPWGGDSNENAWQRLRTIVKYLSTWAHLGDIDYILWFSDDCYVSVPNAKKMLREPHFAELDRLGVPMLLGHRMISGGGEVFVSSSTFIMNRMVLSILVSLFAIGRCDPLMTAGADDLPLARCLASIGIYPLDTYDEKGEDRFSPFNPWQIADVVVDHKTNPWYADYRPRPMPNPKTREALSMYPVALHYMELRHIDEVNAALDAKVKKGT